MENGFTLTKGEETLLGLMFTVCDRADSEASDPLYRYIDRMKKFEERFDQYLRANAVKKDKG